MKVFHKTGSVVELKPGMRVRPIGPNRNGLPYGYVQKVDPEHGRAAVYWPQIGITGDGWSAIDLMVVGPAF